MVVLSVSPFFPWKHCGIPWYVTGGMMFVLSETKRPYTLKGKDWTEIDCLCLTMIDPASSWFEIVEQPVTTEAIIFIDTKGKQGNKTHNNT